MDFENIVAVLKQELARINGAIAALEGTVGKGRRPGRPPKGRQTQARQRGPRTMSAAARAKIAAAQRARWAKQKRTAAGKKSATKKPRSTGRKAMSAAARKKLSAMMKARWAARKKAAAVKAS